MNLNKHKLIYQGVFALIISWIVPIFATDQNLPKFRCQQLTELNPRWKLDV